MSFKQLNPGLLTSMRGCEVIAFGLRFDDPAGTNNPTNVWDAGGNAVVSVVRAAEGRYTVTLNKPYPREIVAALAQCEDAQATTAVFVARVVTDSYSASAGTFTIQTMQDANGDGAWAEADPTNNSTLSVVLFCQTMDALVESHGS